MAWLQGMYNDGILLKEKDDKHNNNFYTSKALVASSRPYITVTYSDDSIEASGQGVENNTKYYIVNKETGNYLTSISEAIGTNITQQEFRDDYEDTQQWNFTEVASSGTYKITLADTGKCIKNETYGAVDGLLLGTTATNSAQRWEVLRNWNGTYRFCSQVSPYNSVQADEWTTDAFLTTYFCDFNHYDEWTLIPVTKDSASFLILC